MNFRKLYIVILLLLGIATTHAQSLTDNANDAYQKGDYARAIELYEQSAARDGISAALYYNLGNAYYKNRQYPQAILNYERALLLEPRNEDARFNLDMARAHITDKIEPVGTFFLVQWITAVRDLFSSNGWATIAVLTFFLFLCGVVLYFFTSKVGLRKIGFFGGLLALLISLTSNHFATEQKELLTHRNHAIIFAPTITIKSSPAASGTDLFVLHEGTKVTLLDKVGDWCEILLEDGNRGWIPANKLEII